jgi:thiamine-monophosphate kinase
MMKPATEAEIIARFSSIAGAGSLSLLDDAACITAPEGTDMVISADAFHELVHFFPEDLPQTVAKRSFRATLSDLAAKGAQPLGFVLTLGLPPLCTMDWVNAFAEALHEDIVLYKCPLLGGDTIRIPSGLTLSLTAFGSVPRGCMVRRTEALPGDLIFVTGCIGDGALGLSLRKLQCEGGAQPCWHDTLNDAQKDALLSHFFAPHPRFECCTFLHRYVHASQDISDGLLGDVTRLLSASHVEGCVYLDRIPFSSPAHEALKQDPSLLYTVLTGGDDYEIIGTLAPGQWEAFRQACQEVDLPVQVIGRVTRIGQKPLRIVDGKTLPFIWNPQWNGRPLCYTHDHQ